jgi:K+-sensing histidine kinase KdpD/CheY-like chemotaxis protein
VSEQSVESTILVVDDEAVIRETLERLLSSEGYAVASANSGTEGLAKAAELVPDLVLLDVVMPDLDGFEVCRRLRSDPLLAEVPVVMVTALGERGARLKGFEAGADDFVSKPFDNAELLARVRTITRLNRYRRLLEEQARRQEAEKVVRQRTRALELINRSARAFSSTLNLDRVLETVLEGARHLLDVVACSVWLVDRERNGLVCRQASGPGSDVVRDWQLDLDQGLAGWVARTGESLIVSDTRRDERHFKGIDRRTNLEMRAVLSVPLRVKERVIGVVQVVDVAVDRFTAADQTLMESLAASAAVAIENAQLYEQARSEIAERRRAEEELRRRNRELRALNTLAAAMGRSLDLARSLEAALISVLDVMEVGAGWVQLADDSDEGGWSLVAHRGLRPEMVEAVEQGRLAGALRDQVSRQERVVQAKEGVGEAFGAVVGVPIRSRDRVLGVLYLLQGEAEALTPQEEQLLTAIGHQIGVSVENMRLVAAAADAEILRELNRLRSELVANVSHELRTPLGLIKIFCTTLLRQDVAFDDETQREFLGHIDEEAEKLEKIVDNLLDLSQLRDGQMQLDKQATDIGELAHQVMEGMAVQLKGHRFAADFPAEPLVAHVDARRVEQVLRNLLSNAIKYSPAGGTISVHGRGDRRQLLVWVGDEGMGIPPQDLERVFERFYRVESEVAMRESGAGLGLSVCKGIVEAHGGRIWAESTLGVGSTFYFTLPVGDDPSADDGSLRHKGDAA